jgi:adenylate cyclase
MPHAASARTSAVPDKPSIVVLPFVNMSKDPDQDYFSDGLTDVLTGDLSKISSLFVIARNSAFTYKGKAVNMREQLLGITDKAVKTQRSRGHH